MQPTAPVLRYPFDQFPVERRQISSYGDVDGPEIAVQMHRGLAPRRERTQDMNLSPGCSRTCSPSAQPNSISGTFAGRQRTLS